MKENITFSAVITRIMRERKLSQMRLSQMLGIRQSQISNWVNGKSVPTFTSLKILQEKLQLTGNDLFA